MGCPKQLKTNTHTHTETHKININPPLNQPVQFRPSPRAPPLPTHLPPFYAVKLLGSHGLSQTVKHKHTHTHTNTHTHTHKSSMNPPLRTHNLNVLPAAQKASDTAFWSPPPSRPKHFPPPPSTLPPYCCSYYTGTTIAFTAPATTTTSTTNSASIPLICCY